MYSIKAAAQATGLTVETLRAWERRYGVVVPGRDAGGRRAYRPEDLLRLRRLREATERGHPIGRLASLTDEQLASLLDAASDRGSRAASNAFVERILEAVQAFRTAECEQTLTLAVAMLPPHRLVSDVLQPLLRETGERWHRGELAISQERIVSNVVRRAVGLMLNSYDRTASRAAIVFTTLPGERHELGLMMSAMLCASRGFRAHYLGPDLPAHEIALFAARVDAAVVALSVVMRDQLATVPARLAELVEHLPEHTEVWLGGSAAHDLPRDRLPPRCVVLADVADLEQRLEMPPA